MFLLAGWIFSVVVGITPSNQFIFDNSGEPETLDPHRLSAQNDALLALNMFEGLVTRDSTYLKLEPALAAHWEVSRDGLKYTFSLQKGLKWSNGEAITAEQIRGSFLRAMDPAVACSYLQYYTENIEGADEFVKNYNSSERKKFEDKLGIRLKGDLLEIKLKRPNILFIDYLTQPHFSVVHPSMWSATSKAWNNPAEFIVNGAYKLKTWEVNKQVVLEKNPSYREASRIKIPTIVALPINDQNTVYNLYRSKQIDWTGENTIASQLVSSLRADPEFSLMTSLGTYTYVLNVSKKPLDNVKVRRALSHAIHRAEVTDKILRGGQLPSNRYVPPGIETYRPNIDPPAPFDKQIEVAKNLLAEAGFPEGKGFPELTIAYNTNESHHKIAQAVQQMWKKYLGVNVKLENKEWKVFLEEQSQKKYDISRQSWIGDLPDAANMMDIFVSGGGNNHSLWGSPTFDRLIRESFGMRDKKARAEVLSKAEKILLDEVPIIPIYHYVFYSLMSPRVKGFQPNMFGKYQFKYFTKN
jgi:oligopeptide transport system substrate-binding protein